MQCNGIVGQTPERKFEVIHVILEGPDKLLVVVRGYALNVMVCWSDPQHVLVEGPREVAIQVRVMEQLQTGGNVREGVAARREQTDSGDKTPTELAGEHRALQRPPSRHATSVRQARHTQTELDHTEPCIECSRFLMSSGREWGEYAWRSSLYARTSRGIGLGATVCTRARSGGLGLAQRFVRARILGDWAYSVTHHLGLIPNEVRNPCRTLVACLPPRHACVQRRWVCVRPVVRSVHVRLCTLRFHGYARLRTLTPQHSAHLCTLGLGDTELDLLYSHAQILCRKKIGAGGIFV